MSVKPALDEPTIPPRVQRPLAAVWISLGLHAAVIALVQLAPPAGMFSGGPVIEARLVSTQAAPSGAEMPEAVPRLAPSEAADALPGVESVPPLAAEEPAAADAGTAATPVPDLAPRDPAPPDSVVTLTSAVDLTFYSAREVDVHPRALLEIVPEYPAAADRDHLSGTVRLQLKLEADGRVSDVEVVSSSPPGLFDEAAVKAFRAARFAPAERNGRPVRALMLIELGFDWEGRPQ